MFLPEKTATQDWLGVIIAVPEPWASLLAELRLSLGDRDGAVVPAHITLVPPIPVENSKREDVIRHLRNVTRHFRPFRIRLGKAETFAPISPVSYVTLEEGASACAELADEIRGGPLNYHPRFPYHPHVTVYQGRDTNLEEIQAAVEQLDAAWTNPGFRLDRVSDSGSYSSVAIFDFAL